MKGRYKNAGVWYDGRTGDPFAPGAYYWVGGNTRFYGASMLTLYTGAQFVGRLFGDRLAQVLGPRRMVFASGVIAMLGLGTMWAATSVAVAYVGFTLLGLGLASVAPLMLSAAGRIDPANAGRNIGIVNGLGFSGLLVGPASITLVVQGSGLQWMPLLPFLFMLAVAVCGPLLMRFAPVFRRSVGATIPTKPVATSGANDSKP